MIDENSLVSTADGSTCSTVSKTQDKLDASFLFNYFKSYTNKENTTFGNLLMPPDTFYNYVNQLDTIFIVNFPILAVENNVGIKLKNFIDNVPLAIHVQTLILNI